MKRHIGITLFLFTLVISNAARSENLSLSDAISKALESNYSIRIIRQNERVAETRNSWGAAGRYPSIAFGVSSNNRYDFNEGSDLSTSSISPGISLNWVLFNGFSVRINKEKLETFERLSRGSTAVLVEQTVQSIVKAYYRALLEKDKLEVFREIMSLSGDRYDYAETSKEIGITVSFDVLQAKNAWLEDKAAFMQQEVTFSNTLRDLKYLMGESDDGMHELTDEFSAQLNDYDPDALKAKMLENNRTLKNQYVNMMLLEKEIALAKSLYFPSVTLRAGTDAFSSRTKYEGLAATTRHWQDAYANMSLSFSLFDGGARKRAMKIAMIQEKSGHIETDEMIHSLTNELSKLYDLYEVRKDIYEVAEENIEAAKLNMQISGDRFRAGTINSFNYRDVQLIYMNAAIGRLLAIYNLIDTDTGLARITGGIVTEIDNQN